MARWICRELRIGCYICEIDKGATGFWTRHFWSFIRIFSRIPTMKRSTLGMDIFRHMTIFRLTVLLTFFLFAECAAGSCLSYGHSCWGAHGKRSGGNVGSPTYLDNNKLLLMRLMKQNAYSRGEINNEPQVIKEYENIPSREELQRFLNGVEQESNQMKGLNEYDSESDVLFDENQPMLDEVTANHLKPSLARRISSRILKKRSTKMD